MKVSAADRPPVVVTRPQPEAEQWCQALVVAGVQAIALPLIRIDPVQGDPVLDGARQNLGRYAAVFFVSAQAVRGFWAASTPPAVAGHTRFWAPGPGTVRALVAVGVSAADIDAPGPDAVQFDSEALWAVVGGQLRPGDRVLVVRGGDSADAAGGTGRGREWLAQRCRDLGAEVDWCVAYRRARPLWSPEQLQAARQAVAVGGVWVFSSSEAVHNLARLWPDLPWRRLQALATHPRITETLSELGVQAVRSTRPTLPDVLSGLESATHG